MKNALIRVPQLEQAEVKKFYNGPESFTPDNNFLLGEAPELRNFYIGAGFNSMGIASAGGAGKALAEWIVNGGPTMDLWPVDIRRFARFNNNQHWLHDRVKETLGLHYAMPWPNRELESARPLRRSPLYDRLSDRRAVFGSKMGWERANWFADTDQQEHHRVRTQVGLFDQSSFGKLIVEGPDASTVLNQICAANIEQPIGKSVYTGMLNDRGGYESDLTVMRLEEQRFLIITGSAQAIIDRDWIRKNTPAKAHCYISDVTSAWCVLSVMGPNARMLLERVSSADLSNQGFPFGTMQQIDVGYATVYANRMSYVGELGWELVIPTEFTVGVYELLHKVGNDLGLSDVGYYALESLRLEKGFIGKDALLAYKSLGVKKQRVVQLTVDDNRVQLWGGELVLQKGSTIGEVRSAAFGYTLGTCVALALLKDDTDVNTAALEEGEFQIDVGGKSFNATVHLKAAYDPESVRVKYG